MFLPTYDLQLRDIKSVAASTVATINCPKGQRYRRITLTLGDTSAGNTNAPAVSAIVDEIQVTLGSKVIRRLTGAQLDYLNTLNGAQYGSYGVAGAGNGGGRTYLPIYFEEPWRKRADFQNGLAVETGWLDANGVFQVTVKLQAGITPVLAAVAIVDDFSSGKANPIMKYFSDDAGTPNSATLDLSNIFQGNTPSDLIESITLFDPSDSVAQSKQVTVARLMLNGKAVVDDVTVDQMTAKLKGADMNPAVGAYPIVFDHDDLFESLRQISSISASQLTLTFKAASNGTIRRVTQRLGDPTL